MLVPMILKGRVLLQQTSGLYARRPHHIDVGFFRIKIRFICLFLEGNRVKVTSNYSKL